MRQRQRGTALSILLVYCGIVVVVTAAAATALVSSLQQSARHARQARAAALADGGIEYIRTRLENGAQPRSATHELVAGGGRIELVWIASATATVDATSTAVIPHDRWPVAHVVHARLAAATPQWRIAAWHERRLPRRARPTSQETP